MKEGAYMKNNNSVNRLRLTAAALLAALTAGVICANAAGADKAAAKAPAPAKTQAVNFKLPLDEVLVYSVKAFGITIGTQTNTTRGIVTKDNRRTVNILSAVKSSPWVVLISIDNTMETFMDAETLVPVMYEERANEKDWRAIEIDKFYKDYFTFDTKKGLKLDRKEKGKVPFKERPQDELSLIYYVRLLDLAPGKTFTVPACVDNAFTTAEVKVADKRKIKTIHGEKDVYYVTSSLGNSKFFIGADEKRIPYRFEVKLNFGVMSGVLKEYSPPVD
jgi:hypothetical protein